MRGTYELHVQTAHDDSERIVLVLAEKDGAVRGAIIELMGRMFIMSGEKSDGGFIFRVPPSLTIFGDLSFELRVHGDDGGVSGELASDLGALPFTGKRVSDAVFPIG